MAVIARLVPGSTFAIPCTRGGRQLVSEFSGHSLRLRKTAVKSSARTSFSRVEAQVNKPSSSLTHDWIESGENFLDDLSHWISKKVAGKVGPHLPENFDPFDWLPEPLQSRIHSAERAAAIIVRECLVLAVSWFIFARIGRFCQWLSRIHHVRIHKGKEITEYNYEDTAYSAMEDPLRAGLLLWQFTRMLYVIGPFLRLRFDILMQEKVRSIGLIIFFTWFLLNWKELVIERSISHNKAEAPRLIALDRVLSLLLYYLAGTCIGEISGFAFRSVLAIGGVSGIAIGLAAKEIVGNFMSGALLFLVRPFIIGDRVKAESFEGWVEDIDFLHTKVIGYDRSPMLVPNSAIMNEVIINYSRAKCRQLVAGFHLKNEDIVIVDKLTSEITSLLVSHERVDLENGGKPICYLKRMGPEGLELEFMCSIKEQGTAAFLQAKQDIILKAANIVISVGAHFEKAGSMVFMRKEGKVVETTEVAE